MSGRESEAENDERGDGGMATHAAHANEISNW
jgi:hypothetical protein